MTATNHALTGAIIGLTIHRPIIAIPLAVLSHYILDATPHFGWWLPQGKKLKSNIFRDYLIIEAFFCFLVVLMLYIAMPEQWWLAALCAFFASAPDLLSMNQYFTIRRGEQWSPGRYTTFASRIQWFEKPIGAIVELAWFCAAILVLSTLI